MTREQLAVALPVREQCVVVQRAAFALEDALHEDLAQVDERLRALEAAVRRLRMAWEGAR